MEHKENQGSEKKRMRRTNAAVDNDILKAVSTLVKEIGLFKISLPAIAQKAKVDISVIYRHFGTLEKLLDTYIQKHDYWLSSVLDIEMDGIDNLETSLKLIAEQFVTSLSRNKEMQQIMLWELIVDNKTTRHTAQSRDYTIEELMPTYSSMIAHLDLNRRAVLGIIVAGMYYLILRNGRSTFGGIDYSTKKGKAIIIDTMVGIITNLSRLDNEKQKMYEIAKKLKSRGVDDNIISEVLEIPLEEIIGAITVKRI